MADPVVHITNGIPDSGTGNITTLGQTVQAQASTTSGEQGPLVQGAAVSSAPTYTNGTTNPLTTDTSGNLRISGAVTATQSGTWTVQPGNTANTTAWLVTGTGGTFPVTGTFWQATQPISAASLPLPSGAATAANQTNVQGVIGPATAPASMSLTGAVHNASLPSLTAGQSAALQSDANGNLYVNVSGGLIGVNSINNPLPSGTNIIGGTLTYGAVSTSPPSYTSGTNNFLSLDTSGNVRTTVQNGVINIQAYSIYNASSPSWTSATAINTTYTMQVNTTFAVLVGQISNFGTITGGAITFEESYDLGTTWFAIPNSRIINPTTGAQIANPIALGTGINLPYELILTGTQSVRARLSTVIAGTGNAVVFVNQGQVPETETVFQSNALNLQTLSNALAQTGNPAAASAGSNVPLLADKLGKVIAVGAIRTLKGVQKTTISTATETTVVTAGAAGVFQDVYAITITNTSATATFVDFRDATAGTIRMTLAAPAGDTRGFTVPVDSAMIQAVAANNWTAQPRAAVSSIEITMLYVSNT